MIATLIGFVIIFAGFWGILNWFADFLVIVKGFVPISLVLGGFVAVVSGVSSMRKPRNNEKPKA